jgi:hypothetical protein
LQLKKIAVCPAHGAHCVKEEKFTSINKGAFKSMKHRIQKLVSFVLVIAISFAVAVPAFAASKPTRTSKPGIYYEIDPLTGQYVKHYIF